MKLLSAVAGLSGLTQAIDLRPHRPPTSYESAVMGRRILDLSTIGTLSTVFPDQPSHAAQEEQDRRKDGAADVRENRPPGLGGIPFGLMDYIADCEGDGNPTILAIDIETSFKNARDGSNVTLSMRWTPPYPPEKRLPLLSRLAQYIPRHIPGLQQQQQQQQQQKEQEQEPDQQHQHRRAQKHRRARHGGKSSSSSSGEKGRKKAKKQKHEHKKSGHAHRDKGERRDSAAANATPDTVPYSAANLPRLALVGYVEAIEPGAEEAGRLSSCFLEKHYDAKYWLPGNRVHRSRWMRLVVTQVYWLGGFGDRAYIGWIPLEEWQRVTREEVDAIRLLGEKPGWSEWPLDGEDEL